MRHEWCEYRRRGRNSGVAKTTIYRHWPSRAALLIDACSRMGGAQAAPDTGTLRGDLQNLTTTVAQQLRTAAWPSVLFFLARETARNMPDGGAIVLLSSISHAMGIE